MGETSELSNRLLDEEDSTIKSLGCIGCRDPSFIAAGPALGDGKLRKLEERRSSGGQAQPDVKMYESVLIKKEI